jgi:hypothetical protein
MKAIGGARYFSAVIGITSSPAAVRLKLAIIRGTELADALRRQSPYDPRYVTCT